MGVDDIVRVIGPRAGETYAHDGTYWNPRMDEHVSKIYRVDLIHNGKYFLSPCTLTGYPDNIGDWVFSEEWIEKFDICDEADEINAFLSEFN